MHNRGLRRRTLFASILATICALLSLSVPVFISPDASATTTPMCKISSLKVSATNGDGLHHGVELIRFRNVTGTSCTLRGYPEIEAVLLSGKAPRNLVGMYHSSPPGSLLRASGIEMSWAGGVNWSTGFLPSAAAQKAFVPPTITLAPRTGVASSTLNWVDGPNTGTCPAFTSIRIGVGGQYVERSLELGYADPLCYEFDVTPIVQGPSGSMNVKEPQSTK